MPHGEQIAKPAELGGTNMAGHFFGFSRLQAALHGTIPVLLLGLTVSGCGKESATGPTGTTVGPTGCTLTFAGGSGGLVFSAAAVSHRVAVSVQATNQYPANPGVVPCAAYQV